MHTAAAARMLDPDLRAGQGSAAHELQVHTCMQGALLAPSAPGTQLQICFFLAQLHLTWSRLVSTDTILMVAVLFRSSEMGVMVTLRGAGVLLGVALFRKLCWERGGGDLRPEAFWWCSQCSNTSAPVCCKQVWRGAPSEKCTSAALRWTSRLLQTRRCRAVGTWGVSWAWCQTSGRPEVAWTIARGLVHSAKYTLPSSLARGQNERLDLQMRRVWHEHTTNVCTPQACVPVGVGHALMARTAALAHSWWVLRPAHVHGVLYSGIQR